LNKQGPSKILGVLNGTQRARGIPTWVLCQKNQTTVKTEHKAVMVGDRTTYRTLSPETELINSPICERCLEKHESATHILWDCEAIEYLRFRHLGH
jgi:hypothetical protein